MAAPGYPKIAQHKTVADFRRHLDDLGLRLPVDDEILTAEQDSPMARPLKVGDFTVGNRWCIHPMEGWDAQADGNPSEHTLRRWRAFGRSGAKWIWGGEAAAVTFDGRANPRQLMAMPEHLDGLVRLRETLLEAHRQTGQTTDDLLIGLQLTHSGRFSRPNGKKLEPRIAYHHPLLDAKFGIDPADHSVVWTDGDLERLIDRYVEAATTARKAGFHFVDVKACHGYLLHEFLSARTRPGRFGGDLDDRSRLLRTIVGRIRDELPDLMIGVRLSVFDIPPYMTGRDVGRPMDYRPYLPYEFGFGCRADDPMRPDLTEPIELLRWLSGERVAIANITAGSPYYNPHIQRPAMFPPSDGYLPPEDPLAGVVRQIEIARRCKEAVPKMPMVGTAYTYLQDFLPHVAQGVVRAGWIDAVGLGRMVLAYPELPGDSLRTGAIQHRRLCRTFSDCTTAPRNGIISGCYPLDPYYRGLPEAERLKEAKSQRRG